MKKINIQNFKCFEQAELNFGKITLLTGANSSGKSSLIDAILAVMQSDKFPLMLDFNGKYNNIGGYDDISHNKNGKNIDIDIEFANILNNDDKWIVHTKWQKSPKMSIPILSKISSDYQDTYKHSKFDVFYTGAGFQLETKDFENNYANIKDLEQDIIEKSLIHEKSFQKNIFDDKFNYISSIREEPGKSYMQANAKHKIMPNGNGFALQILEWENEDIKKLKLLTNYLKELKLLHSIKTITNDDGTFKIFVKIHKNSTEVALRSVGLGLSKILPILVADLQLPEHSLLAVSEPELDLHPSAQADFANYLCKQCLNNNKQYIIETHSEYIINRLRLLIVKGELKEDDVNLYYFENNGKNTKTHNIRLHKNGQISNAPESFFSTYHTDVFDIALSSTEN